MDLFPPWERLPGFWTIGKGSQKNRDKNVPELPNLTAYEDYNKFKNPSYCYCYVVYIRQPG